MFQTNDCHHVCHLFATRSEQVALASAFLSEGLSEDEACLLLASRHSVQDWFVQLHAKGVDVELEQRRKALEVIAGDQRRSDGAFNSIVKAGEVLGFIQARIDFPGVRILADVGWGFDPPLPADVLCHWEATADLALADLNVRAVCQYDVPLGSPSQVCAALRTHRLVILEQRLYRSPFFEAPRILENEPHRNHSFADAHQVRLMLRQLEAHPVDTSRLDPTLAPSR